MPKRIQRLDTKKWKMPRKAVYVGKGSPWASPFEVGVTQVRVPGSNGQDWDYAPRTYTKPGEPSPFFHDTFIQLADGSRHYEVTWHSARDATAAQCVQLYREYITGKPIHMTGKPRNQEQRIKEVLRGKDLVCWCPLHDGNGAPVPCHADVLLEIANSDAPSRNLMTTLGLDEVLHGFHLRNPQSR